MKKPSDVVMLPTEKASHIGFYTDPKDTRLYFNSSKTPLLKNQPNWKPQHLYFLSDDEIKDGDWVFDVFAWKRGKGDVVIQNVNLTQGQLQFCKKIIATTDESLVTKHNCNCFATTYEGCSECLELLPRPSNEFLKKFCELGGIDKVLVEYDCDHSELPDEVIEQLIKIVDVIKVAPDNTITIYPI